jgi:hypothetical protein
MKPKPDPILEDIQRAVKDGFFDDWQPSELLATPVEELLDRVAMMSDGGRRKYLESIGHQRGAAESPGVFGLPADDQLRFGAVEDGYDPGELLGDAALGDRLGSIIKSWPTWNHWNHWAMPTVEEVRGWLSRKGGKKRRQGKGKWLSRDG